MNISKIQHFNSFLKRLLLTTLTLFSIVTCFAQTKDRSTALSLYGGVIQYKGELGNDFFKTDNLRPSFAFSISKYLSPSFNLGIKYFYGDIEFINDADILSGTFNNVELFLNYKFNNGKILKEDATLSPYLIAGFGAGEWNAVSPKNIDMTDACFPLGAGIRIRASEKISVQIQSQYHFTMSDKYDNTETEEGKDNFLQTMIGISFNIGAGKDEDHDGVTDKKDHCPGTPAGVIVDLNGCPLDRDSDMIADYLDSCPDVRGQITAKGCPDKDLDSVPDVEDHCPDIFGPVATFGCPDRDLDSVLDANDICPDEKGLVSMQGCPDADLDSVPDKDDLCPGEKGPISLRGCPDRDFDGIADKDDLCPDVAGIIANKGCPEMKEEEKKVFEEALTGLQFETGKDKIKKLSYPVMDAVVKVMSEHPEYKLVISGHTDNTGTAVKNQELSEERAAAAKNYLTSHGIDGSRITSAGYGDTMPVDDNKTSRGRAKNRRVEFKVVY
jgi:OOP family OmpA-OmpF porin